MKNDNYQLGQLFWPVLSQIDVQRIMLGFFVEGHVLYMYTSRTHQLDLSTLFNSDLLLTMNHRTNQLK